MTVADMSKTIDFYCSVLGTTMVEFMPPTGGPVRKSLHFGKQKINLHDAAVTLCTTCAKPRKLAVLIYVLSAPSGIDLIGRGIWLVMG
jgi:hypothetical protein